MAGDSTSHVTVIGAGLAGCEAAWQLAERGVDVTLCEMRPDLPTPVHRTGAPAELVCSNSLKSMRIDSAAGLLKHELTMLGSFLLSCALKSAVPAGGALAVDRDVFSGLVQQAIEGHPRITVVRGEVTQIPDGFVIVAAGPMASDKLSEAISELVGSERLAFYDAAAPIVEADSIDYSKVFAQSRYDKGDADYLNAPFERDEYEAFVAELIDAKRVIARDFERRELFAACQPVEEVARTGLDALRFGALKPVGLTDPETGRRPWAAVQLRAENAERTAYNLVGFQTNLTWPEQERVFRMVPGLENAEFSRFGVMHRNTFIDSPHVLDRTFAVPTEPRIRFAGQITGTEGYCEAIASGLLAGLNTFAQLRGLDAALLPSDTGFGALASYATDPATEGYQPMHVNFGIVPALEKRIRGKRDRYAAYSKRALQSLSAWTQERGDLAFLRYEDCWEVFDGSR